MKIKYYFSSFNVRTAHASPIYSLSRELLTRLNLLVLDFLKKDEGSVYNIILYIYFPSKTFFGMNFLPKS